MESFLAACRAVGHALHWLTGWLVHPKKGGCCSMSSINKVENEEKE